MMNKIKEKIKKHNRKHAERVEASGYFLKENTKFTDEKGRLKFGVDKIKLASEFKEFIKK